MDIQNISNHSPFIFKPTQEIHDKQITEYNFYVIVNAKILWFSKLVIDQEYPRDSLKTDQMLTINLAM